MGKDNYQRFYLIALFALIAALHWSCKEDKGDKPVPDTDEKSIHINLAYLDFPAEGGMEEVDFSATTDWQVINPADTWLQITPTSGTSGQNLTLQLQTDKNEDSAERQAKIIVRSTAGNSADTLTVRQAGTTRYVDIDWENNTTLTQFDLNSGNVSFTYSGTVPDFTPEVSTIVVPTDSLSYIRVVKSATVSGNSISLQTEEGDMTDLFMDQEFTLSISPNPNAQVTKSGKMNTTDNNGVIHPCKIIARTENGQRITLYDTKSDNINVDLWSKTIDKTGDVIYDKDGVKLFWEKHVLSGSLEGNFYFGFISEEKSLPGGIQFETGRLNNFYFFLDGNLSADLKMVLEATIEKKDGFVETLIPRILDITAVYLIGNIPLEVHITSDILTEASIQAEAKATLTAGFNAGIGLKAGMNYINDGLLPIFEPSYYFEPYLPTLTLLGTVDVKAAVYPGYKVRFYNFAGPNLYFKNYIGLEAAVGAQASFDPSLNYAGWTAGVYQQAELEGNLSLEFIGTHTSKSLEWEADKEYIAETPKTIELISPIEDETVYPLGEPITVTFRVNGLTKTEEAFPTMGVVVQANAFGGETNNEFYLTDENGECTITYTPQESDSRLGVYVVDAEGEPLAAATFTPNLESQIRTTIVGTWLEKYGLSTTSGPNGEDRTSIEWYNRLTFHSDGTYSFIMNPEKKVLYYTLQEKPRSTLYHVQCEGTYTYDYEMRKLVLNVESVRDYSERDGEASEIASTNSIICNLYGRSGTYTNVRMEMRDEGFALVIPFHYDSGASVLSILYPESNIINTKNASSFQLPIYTDMNNWIQIDKKYPNEYIWIPQ